MFIKQIKKKNAILQEQKAEIAAQRDEITFQRDEIGSQNTHITDSINYAKLIQQAMLPTSEIFEESFSEHFILFKPRDVVSG
ncbi:MAG: serine/threonine protein kinase, partial [Cyclobacteriaceae bacterium]|nr:serine/threonine protein kinase [Cyclobacteriaceae bacterium]